MHTSLKSCTFPIADISGLKKKVLSWLRPFSTFCFLDNQQYSITPHRAESLVAAGVKQWVSGDDIGAADSFFQKDQWLFGHLSYALKDKIHSLPSGKNDPVGFPPYYFFSPEVVLEMND